MRRQIAWTERPEDGAKVDIRVTIHGDTVRWQFLRSDSERWEYDLPPTEEQWDELERRLRNRYQRGYVALDREQELVRKARHA